MSHTVRRTWEYDPALYAPARYRKGCGYDALCRPYGRLDLDLPGEVAGVVSDAEAAVHALNARGGHALAPLARLLLRTESIASSKVEGMAVDARALRPGRSQRRDRREPVGDRVEVLANIDAMQLAVEQAAGVETVGLEALLDIHRALMAGSPTAEIGGQVRAEQNWIGGNDYNPCGADFVPPPPEEVDWLLDDLCRFSSAKCCRRWPRPPSPTPSSRPSTRSPTATGAPAGPWYRSCCADAGRRLATSRRSAWSSPRARPATSPGSPPSAKGGGRGYVTSRSRRPGPPTWPGGTWPSAEELTEEWTQERPAGPDPRSDAAAWAVIDVLVGYPVVTVGVAVAATGRTKPAVGAAIDRLVEAGVLVPLSASRRNRAWEAAGLLDLVVEMDHAETQPAHQMDCSRSVTWGDLVELCDKAGDP